MLRRPPYRTARFAATVAALGALTVTTGCGSTASKTVDKVTNDVSSAASKAAASASSAASKAAASASSAASSAMNSVKGAVTATGDVKAGPVTTGSEGKAQSTLTVSNSTADQHDYTISVSFEDKSGSVLDATVVNVPAVPGHGTTTATATSNRNLDNATQLKITAAVRH